MELGKSIWLVFFIFLGPSAASQLVLCLMVRYFVAVAAVFSLAYKLQPAIIFIDEVDSFLGQRRASDHEALTNMKTDFMALWDGFTTDRKFMYSKLIMFSLLCLPCYL